MDYEKKQKADKLYADGHYLDALIEYTELLDDDSTGEIAYRIAVSNVRGLRDEQGAEYFFERAKELGYDESSIEAKALDDEKKLRADSLFRERKYLDALGEYSDLLNDDATGEIAYRLGVCNERGLGDKETAKYFRERALELGFANLPLDVRASSGELSAQCEMGDMFRKKAHFFAAAEWYKDPSDAEIPSAMFGLAWCYENERYLYKEDEALPLYEKAAEAGNPDAQYKLGAKYQFGNILNEVTKEAFSWYLKAAEQGHIGAERKLGSCYERGKGVGKDLNEAIKWYKKAAEQGDASAQYDLGVIHCTKANGRFYKPEQAVEWFKKAAEQGNEYAASRLGDCYYYEIGARRDYDEAFKWYEKAASKNNREAQYMLGLCYERGHGAKQDIDLAITWYKKAASRYHKDAKNALERLKNKGLYEL